MQNSETVIAQMLPCVEVKVRLSEWQMLTTHRTDEIWMTVFTGAHQHIQKIDQKVH